MTRYIDADHLKSWILARWEKEPNSAYPLKASEILRQIDREKEYPIVDAEPVRHGKWINREFGMKRDGKTYPFWERYECSICGERADQTTYCPNCGARMDEE